MSPYSEEELALLLRTLPRAPEAWVAAAQLLPTFRAEFDEIVMRAEEDEAFREALVADLERALAEAGYEPAAPLVHALRERLSS
jgi:hypothetical protein